MALTPDDVLQKRFETTRFRDGYDQDEVDDFLDEVVAELRRLTEENEQLRAGVVPETPAVPAEVDTTELDALRAENEDLKQQLAAAAEAAEAQTVAQPVVDAEPAAEEAPEAEAPAEPEVVEAAPAAAVSAGATDASALIALAERVHDEHIAAGEAKRDELIAAAEASAKEIEDQAAERKTELEQDYADKKAKLEEQKTGLEAKIDELKSFERDYRLKLRGYIESQLRDLDRSSSLAFGGQGNNG